MDKTIARELLLAIALLALASISETAAKVIVCVVFAAFIIYLIKKAI